MDNGYEGTTYMTWETELSNSQFQLNIVITMDGINYARFQVDSGLVIDSENLIVGSTSLPASTVDLRNVRTTLASNTFTLLDVDGLISSRIGASASTLLNVPVIIRAGFITGSYDFADYEILSSATITAIKKGQNQYTFTAKETTSALNVDIYDDFNTLAAALAEGETTEMLLDDVSVFADSGTVNIGSEFITYTGRDVGLNKLTSLTRGDLASTAAAHNDGAKVFRVDTISDNPINLLLQLMISPGGGGTYDVLTDGAGINQTTIDVAAIEAIRDSTFPSDTYRFQMVDVNDALAFLETELLQATNTRFITVNGKISLALLDQATIGEVLPEINEDSITGFPSWNTGSDKIVNRIIMNYNFSAGTNSFTRTDTFNDTDSQSIFDKTNTITFSFKGIEAALNGAAIVANRANRLLGRLASAQTSISCKTLFTNANYQVGDKIRFIHRYLPDLGGALGIDDDLEVISRGYDLNSGTIAFKLSYTSASGLRLGLIAPSPLIVSVASQSIFDVPDGSAYEIDYIIDIDGELRTIVDVTGNTLTVDIPFVTVLDNTKRVNFPDYDASSEGQHAKYAYVNPTGFGFADSSGPDLISF